MTEAAILARVRVALSKAGAVVFRNNSGKYITQKGHAIAYGVGPPGGGGSDLIGWRSVLVTPDMVGTRVAVFLAVETKHQTIPTMAQRGFLSAVSDAGGIAILAHSEEEAVEGLSRV